MVEFSRNTIATLLVANQVEHQHEQQHQCGNGGDAGRQRIRPRAVCRETVDALGQARCTQLQGLAFGGQLSRRAACSGELRRRLAGALHGRCQR